MVKINRSIFVVPFPDFVSFELLKALTVVVIVVPGQRAIPFPSLLVVARSFFVPGTFSSVLLLLLVAFLHEQAV